MKSEVFLDLLEKRFPLIPAVDQALLQGLRKPTPFQPFSQVEVDPNDSTKVMVRIRPIELMRLYWPGETD
jgi:hypothetical protein